MIQYVRCDCGGEHRINPEEPIQPLTHLLILCPIRKEWTDCIVLLGVDEEREEVIMRASRRNRKEVSKAMQ